MVRWLLLSTFYVQGNRLECLMASSRSHSWECSWTRSQTQSWWQSTHLEAFSSIPVISAFFPSSLGFPSLHQTRLFCACSPGCFYIALSFMPCNTSIILITSPPSKPKLEGGNNVCSGVAGYGMAAPCQGGKRRISFCLFLLPPQA